MVDNEQGKVVFIQRYTTSQVIYKPDTWKVQKGRAEDIELILNVQADRANEEHRICL